MCQLANASGTDCFVEFMYASDLLEDGDGELLLSQLENTVYTLILLTPDYAGVEEVWYTALDSFSPSPVVTEVAPEQPQR